MEAFKPYEEPDDAYSVIGFTDESGGFFTGDQIDSPRGVTRAAARLSVYRAAKPIAASELLPACLLSPCDAIDLAVDGDVAGDRAPPIVALAGAREAR